MCDKNPQKIKNMFDNIASYYDKMNDLMSFYMHKKIKASAVKMLGIKPKSYVLDLCCGTGDLCGIISRIGRKIRVIGVDNSLNMLKIAKTKYPELIFMEGDCTNLPFCGEFDYVTISFGLRNIQNRELAISQIYKSLKIGGEFLHLDFGRHNFSGKIFEKIVLFLVKILKKDEKSYQYLLKSKNSYPEPSELIKEFERAGFKFVKQKDFLFGAISAQVMKK